MDQDAVTMAVIMQVRQAAGGGDDQVVHLGWMAYLGSESLSVDRYGLSGEWVTQLG